MNVKLPPFDLLRSKKVDLRELLELEYPESLDPK
jgi:hypothetical protein